MHVSRMQKFAAGIVSMLLLSACAVQILNASAESGSSWMSSTAPTLNKVVDLPPDSQLDTNNTDCIKQSYTPPLGPAQAICTFQSPLGTLTTDGRIQVGAGKFTNLYGMGTQESFIPTLDPTIALESISAPTIGNNIGVYRHLSKSALWLNLSGERNEYYTVPTPPEQYISHPITGKPLEIATYNVAFSENGEWMLANMPHAGLLRVHMSDLSTLLFTKPIEPEWYLGVATPQLAISDDGRYAAADGDIFSSDSLSVYDLSTCTDQLMLPEADRQYCAEKDILHGKNLAGVVTGEGIAQQVPGLTHPTHIRFVNDNTISFEGWYDLDGATRKVASFTATAAGYATHNLGLLGLGDSYISGQGAFNYRDGTDTYNDFCHLSPLSYPFLLGKLNFNSYNSVACSGARTIDINTDSLDYEGQVRDGVHEDKRDKNSILANFMPGYIYQQEFASAYQPEAMLLSVGGDNVGFADIVKRCVANQGGGTCYDTYEDRAELVKEINRTYPELVHTYTTLREKSGGGRLYVVGYPQIAKDGGNCGLNVHLNSSEVHFSAQLIDYLDSVVQQAASAAGVFYVDTQTAFDGHRLCEAPAGQSAMNGFTVGQDAGVTIDGRTINFIGAESYHPTALGYSLLADAIARATHNLHAAMPAATPYSPPVFDPSTPILQAVPVAGRSLNEVYYDASIASDAVKPASKEPVMVDGSEVQLQPISPYEVVLHSDPVTVGEGVVDADGNISGTMTVPSTTPPGYHTLHIYAKNMAGETVDIQKGIYVVDSQNVSSEGCIFFATSGIDADGDGTDDACDPDISAPKSGLTENRSANQDASHGSAQAVAAQTVSAHTSRSSAGAVLGTSVYTNAHEAVLSTSTKGSLYRLNWLIVALGIAGAITVCTVVYYCLRPL